MAYLFCFNRLFCAFPCCRRLGKVTKRVLASRLFEFLFRCWKAWHSFLNSDLYIFKILNIETYFIKLNVSVLTFNSPSIYLDSKKFSKDLIW